MILGSIPVFAGLATVLFGVGSTVGTEGITATVDSEMRFYAVWYVGAGVVLLWSARNLERATALIRGIAVLLFIGGSSRVLSWLAVGEPHALTKTLMAIELVLPFVVVPWQIVALRRRSG
ncbi:MAG: DUF4345 domain-containing protein [Actinomycetota bacterium]|nr:DUF4345 domain-containing protein [Actinomycetota bacterium]